MTEKEHAKRLLDLLPIGEVMKDKYDADTNQYKFWSAIGKLYLMIEEDFNVLIRELGIDTTEQLIERWEEEFGIPDDYFTIASTLEERIQNVLLKKGGLNLLTITDFQALIDQFSLDITIALPVEIKYPPYDVPFYPVSEPGVQFLLIVTADISDSIINEFLAFMETLLPINVGMLLLDSNL
jgi:uncharacterized protein YmfQ (DUF2313 family)